MTSLIKWALIVLGGFVLLAYVAETFQALQRNDVRDARSIEDRAELRAQLDAAGRDRSDLRAAVAGAEVRLGRLEGADVESRSERSRLWGAVQELDDRLDRLEDGPK